MAGRLLRCLWIRWRDADGARAPGGRESILAAFGQARLRARKNIG